MSKIDSITEKAENETITKETSFLFPSQNCAHVRNACEAYICQELLRILKVLIQTKYFLAGGRHHYAVATLVAPTSLRLEGRIRQRVGCNSCFFLRVSVRPNVASLRLPVSSYRSTNGTRRHTPCERSTTCPTLIREADRSSSRSIVAFEDIPRAFRKCVFNRQFVDAERWRWWGRQVCWIIIQHSKSMQHRVFSIQEKKISKNSFGVRRHIFHSPQPAPHVPRSSTIDQRLTRIEEMMESISQKISQPCSSLGAVTPPTQVLTPPPITVPSTQVLPPPPIPEVSGVRGSTSEDSRTELFKELMEKVAARKEQES